MYWIIETADETGAELNIPFTGQREEALREARLHPGSTLTPYRG